MRFALRLAVNIAILTCLPCLANAGGILIFDLDGNTVDTASALARGADGRLFVAAQSGVSACCNQMKFPILAFDATGEPVPAFGTNGRVDDTFYAFGLAVRSDGALVRVGEGAIAIRDAAGALLIDGQTPSFSGTGFVVGYTVAMQADDRAVIGGGFTRGAPVSDYWTLLRISPDGTRDSTFGAGPGWVHKDASPSDHITSVRVLPSGKILAIGPGNYLTEDQVIGRFNADGTTDFTFGTNGLVALPPCQQVCFPPRLAVDSTGQIYVNGGSTFLLRLTPDGMVDNTYTSVPLDPVNRYVQDIAIDSMDRAVIFGTRDTGGFVARFLTTGQRDTSFGAGGEALVQAGAGTPSQESMVAGLVQPDDKPVALLTIAVETDSPPTLSGGPTDIALVRFTEAGAIDSSFGASHVNPDTYPDAFSFAPNTAPYGTTSVMSGPVTISGINARTSVQLTSTTTNSGYSVGCTGVFVSEPGTLLPNDTLCVRQTASSQPGGTAQTTINVGGRAATYVTTSSSQSADVVPDAFSFVDESGVAPGSTVTSNTITITGLTGAAAVGIDLGAYSIGCVATGFTSRNGSISNGQTICVQHTASSGHNATVTTTLAIGGVTATFASTTVPPDTSPDPFAFQPQSDVPMGSSVISNPATITGIDSPAPISVTGGEYAIGCGGNWTSQPATVSADQQVCIRHIAASQPGTTTTTTLTVGNASASLVSTTVAPSSGGGGGGALSVYDVLGLLALLLSTKYQRLRPKLNAIVCRFGARAPIRNS